MPDFATQMQCAVLLDVEHTIFGNETLRRVSGGEKSAHMIGGGRRICCLSVGSSFFDSASALNLAQWQE
jgi:hypothetical protein